MRVAIVGTGYVGLTTGAVLAYLGHQVSCLDVDERKVQQLQAGHSPIFEPGLTELLQQSRRNLSFTTSYSDAISSAEVVFVTVGTPLGPDGNPNLDYVQQAARQVGEHLPATFTLLVNKSTVPIGSGNWVERIVSQAYEAKHGQKPNGRFAVASNPEFLKEGTALHDSFYPDRIVIGSKNPQAISLLSELYRPLINQDFAPPSFLPRPEGIAAVPVVTTDLASAELIKYAANAFLTVKISFINEIASLAEKVGADVVQLSKGIGLDSRIGPRFLQAGVGWGGSCFGKDTAALIATAQDYGLSMPIVQAAREVNCRQRERVLEKLQEELKILKGCKIGLLGLAFKPNTDDLRDAPALDIAKRLIGRGACVAAHDPIAADRARSEWQHADLAFVSNAQDVFEGADAVVLVTDWKEYLDLPFGDLLGRMNRPVLLDGRNFFPREQLQAYGYRYLGLGR